jgi:hypothetical protein
MNILYLYELCVNYKRVETVILIFYAGMCTMYVGIVRTTVSDKRVASIFKVERISERGVMLLLTRQISQKTALLVTAIKTSQPARILSTLHREKKERTFLKRKLRTNLHVM